MAGRPSLWCANQILRSYFSRAITPPPTFYMALIKDIAPNPYVSASEIIEPDPIASYERAEVPNDLAMWGDVGSSQLQRVSNILEIAFPLPSADWGQISHWALCDSPIGGNIAFYGNFSTKPYVAAGDPVIIDPELLIIELGPFYFDEEPS